MDVSKERPTSEPTNRQRHVIQIVITIIIITANEQNWRISSCQSLLLLAELCWLVETI